MVKGVWEPPTKRKRSNARGVSLKICAGQSGAVPERTVVQTAPDVSDTVGDGDGGQAAAVIERTVSDAGDAARDSDAGQVEAVKERIVPDAGDAAGNGDVGQAGDRKCSFPDVGDAVGDSDTAQAGAPMERRVPNARDAVGNRDAGQVAATIERTPDAGESVVEEPTAPDAGDAVGDRVAPNLTDGILHKCRLVLIEQHPVHTAKSGVEWVHY